MCARAQVFPVIILCSENLKSYKKQGSMRQFYRCEENDAEVIFDLSGYFRAI